MNTLKFKTNINCDGCIAKVTPFLDEADGVCEWSVDTNIPEKVLTIQTKDLPAEQVIETLAKAGFKAEKL